MLETEHIIINFLIIARASISEVQNDLYISLDLNYISKENFELSYAHAQKIAMSINKLVTYLKSQLNTCSKSKIREINE